MRASCGTPVAFLPAKIAGLLLLILLAGSATAVPIEQSGQATFTPRKQTVVTVEADLGLSLPNITIGSLHVDNIQITSQNPGEWQIAAYAWMDITDKDGGVLGFDVEGVAAPNGQAPLYGIEFFGGAQIGSFTPPAGQPVLSALTVEFNVSAGISIIGGAATFGNTHVRAYTDFAKGEGAALGLQLTKGGDPPTLADLPGAPAEAGNITGIEGIAVVISNMEGNFQFPGEQQVLPISDGVNVFSTTKFGAATVLWHGLLQFQDGFSLRLEGDFSNTQFAPGITAENGEVYLQYPAQPTAGASVSLVWTSLRSVQLEGTWSSGALHLEGSSQDDWPINLGGSNPMVMNGIDVTLDFAVGSFNAEAKGTLSWPNVWKDQVQGIMKFPADPAHPHCVALTADVTSESMSLSDYMQHSSNDTSTAASLDPKTQAVATGGLQEVEVAVYPGCGAFYVKGVVDTQNDYGQVTVEFAAYKSVDVSDTVASTAGSLSANSTDPDVSFPLGDLPPATAKASSVLQQVSSVIAKQAPGVTDAANAMRLVPDDASSATDPSSVIVAAQAVCKAKPIDPIVSVTEFGVLVSCTEALDAVQKALQQEQVRVGGQLMSKSLEGELGESDDTNPWMFAVTMTTNNISWPLDSPPDIKLSVPSFALASGSFTITVGDGMFIAQQGLNFMAQIDVDHSTNAALNDFKANASPECLQQTYNVQGSVNNMGWMFTGSLSDGCLVVDGGKAVLTGTSLTLQSSDPQLSFNTQLDLPKAQHGNGLSLMGSATVGQSGLSFSGQSLSEIETKVGHNPIVITSINGDASISWGAAGDVSANLAGAFVLVGESVDCTINVDVAGGDFSFSAQVQDKDGINIGMLVQALLGKDVPGPDDIKQKVYGMKVVEADIDVSTQPPTFTLGGTVAFWLLNITEDVQAHLGFQGDHLEFSFSIHNDPSSNGALSADAFKPSDIWPPAKPFDNLALYDPAVTMSTDPSMIPVPGSNYSVNAPAGFSIASLLPLDSSASQELQNIGKLLKIEQITICGALDAQAKSFSFEAQVNQDLQIGSSVVLHTADVALSVGGDTGIAVSLSSNGQVNFPKSDPLKFEEDISVGPSGFHLEAELPDTWANPFGLSKVSVSNPGLSITFSPLAVLSELGVQGSVSVNGIDGTFDLVGDITDPTKSIIAIDVQKTSLGGFVDAVGNIPASAVSKTVSSFNFDEVMLSLNPSLSPKTVGNVTFPAGLTVEVDNLQVGPIKGSCEVEINPTKGFKVAGDVSPFALGPLFKLNEGVMDVEVMVGDGCEFIIDTSLDILGVHIALNLSIGDSALSTQFDFEDGDVKLSAGLQSSGGLTDTSDFAVSAKLDMGKYLSQEMPKLAKDTQSGLGKKVQDAQAKLSGLQGDINKLDDEIKKRTDDDKNKRSAAEKDVKKADDAVEDAKSKVDELNSNVDKAKKKLKKCGSWDVKCKAKYGEEVAQYETEVKTADAALDAAHSVLKKAQKVLAGIPDPLKDPQILAWEANLKVDEGALAAANATLNELGKLADVCSQTISQGASAFVPSELDFTSGSFNDVAQGKAGKSKVKGKFLGIDVSTEVGMAWNAAEVFAGNVWSAISKAKVGSMTLVNE